MDVTEWRINEILETENSSYFNFLSEDARLSLMEGLGVKIQPDDTQLNNVFKLINSAKTDLERWNLGKEFITGINSNEEITACLSLMLGNTDECKDFLVYFAKNPISR